MKFERAPIANLRGVLALCAALLAGSGPGAAVQLPALDATAAPTDQQPAAGLKTQGDSGELKRHDASSRNLEFLDALNLPDPLADRASWAKQGYTVEAFLTVDGSLPLDDWGESGERLRAARGLLEAVLAIDGAQAFGLPGSQFLLSLQGFSGTDGSTQAGVVQPYSNIDTPGDRFQLARIWYQQDWDQGATYLRLGKMDANSLFATPLGGANFVHSSMALSPTILALPTYPDTAFGAVLSAELLPRVGIELGVFDGAGATGVKTGSTGFSTVFGPPGAVFTIAEATLAGRGGALSVGGWHHSADFEAFDGDLHSGTSGAYLVVDQALGTLGNGGALNGFLQLGIADARVSPIRTHVGAGVEATGLLHSPRNDALGLALSYAELSDADGSPFTADSESALELFFALDLFDGLRIKPDLQYITHPGGSSSAPNLWIATLRLTITI